MASETGKIKFYGTSWCFDCRRARNYLDQNNIPYHWIDIDEDAEAAEFVKRTNRGFRSVPTIVFSDGSILVEPSEKQLKDKFKV